ncbi:MAG: hypothetical protein A3A80_03110 [Candidatus Terrybacteria bacterium RIFCSPLOWO2_01_FULL_44_24]|nr:MAG: hypothetical protein A3A80_03110 [Candidatus Terrybacteria bacterium RIFCSPLOWO2_01_FULL_44_24]
MQLHNIKPTKKNRKAPRIGRGGKRGTYSGRGIKGQKARAGHRIRPAIRDLMLRTPKLRGSGFSRCSHVQHFIVNLSQIEGGFKEKADINPKILVNKNLIHIKYGKPFRVKVLGEGKLTKPHNFSGLIISAKAKEKIIAVGGTIHD